MENLEFNAWALIDNAGNYHNKKSYINLDQAKVVRAYSSNNPGKSLQEALDIGTLNLRFVKFRLQDTVDISTKPDVKAKEMMFIAVNLEGDPLMHTFAHNPVKSHKLGGSKAKAVWSCQAVGFATDEAKGQRNEMSRSQGDVVETLIGLYDFGVNGQYLTTVLPPNADEDEVAEFIATLILTLTEKIPGTDWYAKVRKDEEKGGVNIWCA